MNSTEIGWWGPLPDLSRLDQLERIILADNYLTGEVSAEHLNFSSLYQIHLRGNGFHGCMPDEINRQVQGNDLNQVGLEICGN